MSKRFFNVFVWNLVLQQTPFAHAQSIFCQTNLGEDEFYVSSEHIHLKGRVGGFFTSFDGKFFVFPSLWFADANFSHPRKHFLLQFFSYMVFKKATPFGPGARKVLTYSPVLKRNRCCIRISFLFWHVTLRCTFCFGNDFGIRTWLWLRKIAALFVECRISSEFLYEKLSLICTRNFLWAKDF